jgi:hypothetical protein
MTFQPSQAAQAVIAALRPLADATGAVEDSFRVEAALAKAGLSAADLRREFFETGAIGMAPSLPGTYGHLRFQLPPEHAEPINPAIAERAAQLVQLRAVAPMRQTAAQYSTDGLALFDAIDAPGFDF